MPIAVAAKISALLNGLTTELNELSPVERRRFADLCRHVAKLADRHDQKPKANGVLALLDRGHRAL